MVYLCFDLLRFIYSSLISTRIDSQYLISSMFACEIFIVGEHECPDAHQ